MLSRLGIKGLWLSEGCKSVLMVMIWKALQLLSHGTWELTSDDLTFPALRASGTEGEGTDRGETRPE